ncbi:hypothetical protein LS482_17230 [Sinomicrobium kalidii]|uniref:hypothetical protein n=1 Tax=Sinomicrobium kalidii TaxID=2900738 RepID=UPI001E41F375|nr:hypothetical protein [Sinomicrobium kalidii]UGU15412.1 hypothetical protein LS482_17230 [Sinomicrobium kalidii]
MKIGFYNIENIYHRDASLVEQSTSRSLKLWIEEFERYLCKDTRTGRDYERMRELSFLLGFQRVAYEPYVVMRRRRGTLYIHKRGHTLDYRANTLTDWNGWIKLGTCPIPEKAIANKARVIKDINPDILLFQEIENRTTLVDFNDYYLSASGETGYDGFTVLEGNSYQGLEMALLHKQRYRVISVRSHNYDWNGYPLFERDFQQYIIETPLGKRLYWLSVTLQQPAGNGNWWKTRREAQVLHLARVYQNLWEEDKLFVIVSGTFYAPSYTNALTPLFQETNLKDITKHPSFRADMDRGRDGSYFRLGAYRLGVNIKQQDYLLLSPALFKRVKTCGLHRKGVWPKGRAQWEVYDTLKSDIEAASCHPLLWCTIDF